MTTKSTRRAVFSLAALVATVALACSTPPPSGSSAARGTATATTAVPMPHGVDTLSRVKREKKVRAGWAPYAPYSERNPKTQAVEGSYVELFRTAAKEAGFEVEFVETTWGNMITDLKFNKFDVMISPVFRTIPRSLEVNFTRSISYFGYSAVVRRDDSRFKTLSDFNRAGIRIAVTQGEVGHEYAKRHLPLAELIVVPTGDISRPLLEVVNKRADVGIADAWTIRQFAARQKEVVDLFGEKPFNVVGAGWFTRQEDTEWLIFLNNSIDWLDSSGVVDQVSAKFDAPDLREKKMWTTMTATAAGK